MPELIAAAEWLTRCGMHNIYCICSVLLNMRTLELKSERFRLDRLIFRFLLLQQQFSVQQDPKRNGLDKDRIAGLLFENIGR